MEYLENKRVLEMLQEKYDIVDDAINDLEMEKQTLIEQREEILEEINEVSSHINTTI